jgi:hypothetical protein
MKPSESGMRRDNLKMLLLLRVNSSVTTGAASVHAKIANERKIDLARPAACTLDTLANAGYRQSGSGFSSTLAVLGLAEAEPDSFMLASR